MERFILLELVLISLYFNPYLGIDPYNLPKMLLLVCLSAISFLFLKRATFEKMAANKLILFGVILWILGLITTFFLNSGTLSEKIYGNSGRHVGFLTLFCFLLLTVQSMQASSTGSAPRTSRSILFIGLILSTYSFSQYLENDFSNLVDIYKGMPIGTFGNPNFNSVVLSFVGIACIWSILYHSKHPIWKLLYLAYFLVICFLIFVTRSAQGFWSLSIGVVVIAYSHFHADLHRGKRKLFGIVTLIIVPIVFAGMLSVGPLSKLNEISAIKVRIYYWIAGFCAGNTSPIFGVGFDGYGDLFRRCRPDDAFIWDPNRTTDVSHNIFIDYYVTGGLVLLSGYALLIVATTRKIFAIFNGSREQVRNSSILIAIHFAFLAQGIISINQIGLGIWGWIIMGLILGFPIDHGSKKSKGNPLKNAIPVKKSFTSILSIPILAFIVLSILPPSSAAQNFRKAFEEGRPAQIEKALFQWPTDRSRLKVGIRMLNNSGYVDIAKRAIIKSVLIYPDDYTLWQIYLELFKGTPDEVNALTELQRLDPRFFAAANGKQDPSKDTVR